MNTALMNDAAWRCYAIFSAAGMALLSNVWISPMGLMICENIIDREFPWLEDKSFFFSKCLL